MTDATTPAATPADRGFAEVTDMYGEITDAIDHAIAEEMRPHGTGRLLTGAARQCYDLMSQVRIAAYHDMQELIDEIYAAHDSSDYLEHGRTAR